MQMYQSIEKNRLCRNQLEHCIDTLKGCDNRYLRPPAAVASPKAIPLEKVILPGITHRRGGSGGNRHCPLLL
jgi:hypothetical protein